jgi:hypothetical protein
VTVCSRFPALPEKNTSPEYVAVKVTVPAELRTRAQLAAGNVATQDPPAPSVTVTVPVGVPTAGATGTTAKPTVTDWPWNDGAGESDVIVVVVEPLIVRFVFEIEPRWAEDPGYEAEIVRLPTAVPLTKVEQLDRPATPATRLHDAAGLKASAADEDRVTVPDGLDFVPEGSVSVTVTETVPAAPADSGFGATKTAVDVERLLTWSVRLVVLDWKTPATPG